ncbi:MAG: WD40 repeat domain-containing protein [Flavobacteriales bacterium]|nr:WD40 repeat domain-containing protein [Flavobacteriales bacterium]
MKIKVTKAFELTGHASSVYCLSPGNSEKSIFSGGGDKVVAEWDLQESIAKGFSVKLGTQVYSLCHLKELNILVIGHGKGGLHIIDLKAKKEIKYLTYHQDIIFDLKYSAVNGMLYCACNDGSISVWDVKDFSLVKHILICFEKIRGIDFSSDETEVAFACGDGTIRIYDTKTFIAKDILKGHESAVNCVIYHPTERILISGGKDAHLRFWDMDNHYKEVRSIPAHNYAIYSLDFSPDGKFMATASRDKTVKIWDTSSFDILQRIDLKQLRGHNYSVNKLIWSDYNDYLITTGDDRKIMAWKIKEIA